MPVISEKEAVGVYLLLQRQAAELDGCMARLRKRIEDSLLAALTVDDFGDLAAYYGRLPDRPPGDP